MNKCYLKPHLLTIAVFIQIHTHTIYDFVYAYIFNLYSSF